MAVGAEDANYGGCLATVKLSPSHDSLNAVLDLELLENVVHMNFCRAEAYEKPLCDLGIAETLRKKRHHVEFTLRKAAHGRAGTTMKY